MVFPSPDRRDFAEAGSVRLLRDIRRKPAGRTVVLFNVFLAVALWGGVWCLRQVALSMGPGELAVYGWETILGKWEEAENSGFGIEFTRDGFFRLSWREEILETADYRLLRGAKGDEVELLRPADIEWEAIKGRRSERCRFQVSIIADTLTVRAPATWCRQVFVEKGDIAFRLPPPKDRPIVFRRIR